MKKTMRVAKSKKLCRLKQCWGSGFIESGSGSGKFGESGSGNINFFSEEYIDPWFYVSIN